METRPDRGRLFGRNCSPWEGPHSGAREEREEEEVAQTKCYEQPYFPYPCATWGRGVRIVISERLKLSLGRKEGWRDSVLI